MLNETSHSLSPSPSLTSEKLNWKLSSKDMKAALIYGATEKHTFCQCIGNILKEAVPEILTCILIQLPQLINTYYASTMNDPVKLAGLGLGASLLNITIYIPLTGLSLAVDKLVNHGLKYRESGSTYLN